MKILCINAGSSSLKFTAYKMPEEKVLIGGYFERIGLDNSFYTVKVNGEKIKKEVDLPNHKDAFQLLVSELLDNKIVNDLSEIKGVGHRSVQGGDISSSVIATDEVLQKIKDYSPLAPLHNPASLVGIEAAKEVIPDAVHTVVFDTAFHTTIPEENYMYPVPKKWYEENRVRRYGYHGTSYKYITKAMQERLGKEDVNLIICHIGNGASICAVKDGKSFDTTMGLTPVAGIMMGTRCGDIDPSIITYMIQNGMSVEDVNKAINKESGLFGISGISGDSRDIEEGIANGNEDCILAQKMYVKRIVSTIANYYVELQHCDALVFTAGVGENSRPTRLQVLEPLKVLGINVSEEKNNQIASYLEKSEGIISTDDSKVPVYVLPTNEEVMIAKDTYDLIEK